MPITDRAPRHPRRRLAAAISPLAVIATGLFVHAVLPDTPVTDIAGDALYAAAAYCAVVLCVARWSSWLVAVVAGGWCVAVELFQLSGIPLALGATFPPAMLVLGTVFDARDLVVYIATVVVAGIIDATVRRR